MLVLLTDTSEIARRTCEVLGTSGAIRQINLKQAPPLLTDSVEGWIFAADLDQEGTVTAGIRHLRERALEQPLIVVTARRDVKTSARASALGATRVHEISNAAGLLRDPIFANRFMAMPSPFSNDPVLMAAIAGTVAIVTETMTGRATTSASEDLNTAIDAAIASLQTKGVAAWLKALEAVHSPTYRHVLQVLAFAVSFGTLTKLPPPLLRKLAAASLLHDIGKAKLPVEILNRADRTAPGDDAILQTHVKLGFEMLRAYGERDFDILDAVLHHHEYMDGSGYPHRMKGAQIRPLTRMLTIANHYANLIEQRPSRPVRTKQDAYKRLQAMGHKLDLGLVATFKGVVR
ncbi:HD-GYP domain-containing protein [Chthonobacter albigriseus]|uniref:HD-GYP domain-containing protein n=1 Tax=Chthonobacter albigriseus TaxID=1683161 RepID=UPI0015EE6DB5|nr:HD domain-containing phosphohydrolase [Chthonobacter albigriseus]